MKINVKKLLNGEISSQSFEYEFPIEFKETDYKFPEPAHVKGEIRNAGGYIPLKAVSEVTVEGQCARCLAPVKENLSVEFTRTVAASLEEEDESDEYLLVENDRIEIGEPIEEELILSLPLRLLCQEDCKGLCHKCGKNLNEGKCECPEHDPDPRWAILKKLAENK